MEGQNGKGLPAKRMSRPVYYPESRVKITSPFYLLSCTCGFRSWSLLGEGMICPKCGAYIPGPNDSENKKELKSGEI